jgi:hypothetical protein
MNSIIETDFDYSMMKSYHNCKRRYYYRYVLSVVPARTAPVIIPGAMEFGSAVDHGLDLAYQILSLNPVDAEKFFLECFKDAEYRPNRMITLAGIAARTAFEEEWGDTMNKGYTRQLGVDLLDEYFARWFPESFDTIDSQIGGAVPLEDVRGHEVNLMVKADRLVWGYDPNRYSIFEVKTTSNPNDVWWLGQEMSYQIDGYVLGVEMFHNVDIHSAVIDCLGTKIKKNRLNRRPIIVSPLRRKLYYRWLYGTIDCILRAQEETISRFGHLGNQIHEVCYNAVMQGGAPHDLWLENRSNCTDYWRPCSYIGLCDADCHPGALSNFEADLWRPYMRKS